MASGKQLQDTISILQAENTQWQKMLIGRQKNPRSLYLLVILEIIRDARVFGDIAPATASRAPLQGDLKLLKILINIISFILIITWLRNIGLHRNLEAQKTTSKNISPFVLWVLLVLRNHEDRLVLKNEK